ncbi:MAG TPA: hypothetical protein VG474_04120 [Solirubrobacteraceae bacterium]|nr:hypothetical protein [Solirubrobacteraceae bacterium]
MNALLDPLRQVARDLVEKKLWPIAALLLVAIVAVPLAIGGSTDDVPAGAPVAATAPAADDETSLLTVADEAVAGRQDRPGKVDDPFYDPPEQSEGAATAAGGAAAAPAAGGGGAASAAPASAPSAPSAPSGAVTAPPPADSADRAEPATDRVHYRTRLRWYGEERTRARPVSRLTPFGGTADPALVYLGVTRSDARYAVFLLGEHATSEGEGKCEDDTECRVFGLKSGESRIVTVRPPTGAAPRRYRLEVVSVTALTTSAAEAREQRARVHPDGREVLRAMWQSRPIAEALAPIGYDRDSGLLYRRAAASDAAKTAE